MNNLGSRNRITVTLTTIALSMCQATNAVATDSNAEQILSSMVRHIRKLNVQQSKNSSANKQQIMTVKLIDQDVTQFSINHGDRNKLILALGVLNYQARQLYYRNTRLKIEHPSAQDQKNYKPKNGFWPRGTPWSKIPPGEGYEPGDG